MRMVVSRKRARFRTRSVFVAALLLFLGATTAFPQGEDPKQQVLGDAAVGEGQQVIDQMKKIAALLEHDAVVQEPGGWDRVMKGWEDFGKWDVLLDMTIVLLMSILLGSIIAYHPLTRGKVSSIEEFEQPKTFIMYAMVGAVIAQLVLVKPSMALVVFGIGGLLRFRTDVGQAKDTGRVILVTVVGMCCGLKIFVVAFLAAFFGWILIYYLESQQAERVQIKGLASDDIPRSAEAYRQIFVEAGCAIIRERKNFLKGQVTFVFSVPRGVDRETVQQKCKSLSKELQGTADWDTT